MFILSKNVKNKIKELQNITEKKQLQTEFEKKLNRDRPEHFSSSAQHQI